MNLCVNCIHSTKISERNEEIELPTEPLNLNSLPNKRFVNGIQRKNNILKSCDERFLLGCTEKHHVKIDGVDGEESISNAARFNSYGECPYYHDKDKLPYFDIPEYPRAVLKTTSKENKYVINSDEPEPKLEVFILNSCNQISYKWKIDDKEVDNNTNVLMIDYSEAGEHSYSCVVTNTDEKCKDRNTSSVEISCVFTVKEDPEENHP